MKYLGLSIALIATTLYASACNGSESDQSGVSSDSPGSSSGASDTSSPGSSSGVVGKSTQNTRERPPDPNQTCSTDPVQWVIDKEATPENVERARKESGADTVRVLKPGMAVTQEFKYGRLNLQVDENNIVTSVSCW